MTHSTFEVVKKLSEIATARGCTLEQVAVSLERGEAAAIFYSDRAETYSAHSYAFFECEDLRSHTHWGAYDLNLDGARRVWAEKCRRFMEGF